MLIKGTVHTTTLRKSLIHQKLNEGGYIQEHLRRFFEIVYKLQMETVDELLSVVLL